jgi:Na+/H+ antiporter NhaB
VMAAILLSNVGYILLNVVWIAIAVSGYRKEHTGGKTV